MRSFAFCTCDSSRPVPQTTQLHLSLEETSFQESSKEVHGACLQAEKGSGEDADKSLNDLMREIAAVEMQGLKMKAVVIKQLLSRRGYQEKREALQAEITQAHADIEQKKEELEEARVYKQHMAEYEVLRQIAAQSTLTLKLRKRNRPCPATDRIHRQGRSQI
eukprot:gene8995-16131_t